MAIEFHRDGPWELPDGWVWARAGDVLPLEYGKGLPERVRDTAGEIPVYGSAGVVGTHSQWLIDEPCLVIARKGSVGAVYEEACPSWPIDTVYYARESAALFRRYAYWFFSFWRLDRLDQSTAVPSLSRDNYNEVLIPIAPTAEQRRIVARIDELFTEIADGEASLARARADLDTWRRALLKAAVTGELTREWRTKNGISEWRRTTIGEAGELRLGRQRSPRHHQGDHMRPYLRVANVFEGRLDLTDVKSMNFTPDEFATYELKPGDVLLNEGQSPDLLGRPAIFNGEIDGCCFQNTLLRFRPAGELLSEFSLLVFRHYMKSGRFKREARITTNLAHLSQSRCASIEFPMPTKVEQSTIVRVVDDLEQQACEQFEHIESSSLVALCQSILKAAFEGRLVAQDSRDEPAERLLSRLGESHGADASPRRRPRAARAARAAE